MAAIVPIVGASVFLIGILVIISLVAAAPTKSTIQNVYNDIVFPTGDHIIFYQQAQQIATNAQQLSTNPSIPWKLLGIDSHNNVIAQNTQTQQVVNASSGTPQANAILSLNKTISTGTGSSNANTYLTTTGLSYGAGATLTNPTKSTTCTRGLTCTIAGKIVIADPSSCKKQTVNGVQQNVCNNLLGPFKYTIQLICIDSDAFRCSYLAGVLPTNHGETYPDGSFSINWTPKSDTYFIGNYIARLYAESESPVINGPTVSESGDYPITVY